MTLHYVSLKRIYFYLFFEFLILLSFYILFFGITPKFTLGLSINNFISILLPVYNKISYLNRSMNSVQNQTFHNFEIICVDDYSSDNSTGFILERMKEDPRIRLIQNYYNQGTCQTRINGVFCCSSYYILSLDPDDVLYADAIGYNYNIASKLDADILEYRIKAISSKKIDRNWYPCRHNYTNNKKTLTKLQNFRVNWNLCKKLIKTSLYKKAMTFLVPFVEGKRILFAEDLLQCGTIFFFMKKFICQPLHLSYIYYMSLSENSESGKNQPIKQNDIQVDYAKSVITYFYSHRKNILRCSTKELFKNKTVLSLYNRVSNISKKGPFKNCDVRIPGFTFQDFTENGYCIIKSKWLIHSL